ncbi:hypothetical protein N7495_003738 [Penicillium taxi]|uniref:uncharacterized protein n=1 Tax=Penicillium taxi TaxID=168475 RepID=UPI0025450C10|nr:uncharacterized protein N7495_003738 [Penicillium taxi]KAJ5898994.1 hypothetical protein N7495_003738 [Penicillium taxi]
MIGSSYPELLLKGIMSRFLQTLRQAIGLPRATNPISRSQSIDTNFNIFQAGDWAIFHVKTPILKKLKKGGKTNLRRGHVNHDDVIGRRVFDTVPAHKGPDTRLSLPTLEEYVTLTPRLVTPIYSHDANLIVSLLDIHADVPAAGEQQPHLEILESGTGHGSLTLHLARAIHAANSVPPSRPQRSQIRHVKDRNAKPGKEESPKDNEAATDQVQQEWDEWRAERNAVIHTVDVSGKYSALAEGNVNGFRRGIYAGDVDFYVGAVEDWISEQKDHRKKSLGTLSKVFGGEESVDPFLDHVILDMPSAHKRIPSLPPLMKRDAKLVVFMPSITQIGDCIELIHKLRLPFISERVVELGTGLTSGRHWDVRLTVKKSAADPSSWSEAQVDSELSEGDVEDIPVPDEPVKEDPAKEEPVKEMVMVCRPKVGLKTMGGGFVGVFRRIEDGAR